MATLNNANLHDRVNEQVVSHVIPAFAGMTEKNLRIGHAGFIRCCLDF
jgi:hypothetical protein